MTFVWAARAAGVLLLTVGSLTTSGTPQNSKSGTPHTMGTKRVLHGVPNFGEVTPRLYRGGQPSREGFKNLAAMGVQIVVDSNRSSGDEKLLKGLGIQYVTLPWHCPFPKDKIFAEFLQLMRDNPDKKVFVHCRLGDDRTGMMVASYRMGAQGWSAEEALNEMKEFGYTTVHHFMCPGLEGYEKSFPERLKKSPALRGDGEEKK
jgi:protein tyrosine phosphatase (PTP) superfamily phosphohydrolase (DUF442 family)